MLWDYEEDEWFRSSGESDHFKTLQADRDDRSDASYTQTLFRLQAEVAQI